MMKSNCQEKPALDEIGLCSKDRLRLLNDL